MSRSIIELMIDKKEFEKFSLRKNWANVYAFDIEPEKQKSISQLEEIKMKMRKEFEMKKSEIKQSLF